MAVLIAEGALDRHPSGLAVWTRQAANYVRYREEAVQQNDIDD